MMRAHVVRRLCSLRAQAYNARTVTALPTTHQNQLLKKRTFSTSVVLQEDRRHVREVHKTAVIEFYRRNIDENMTQELFLAGAKQAMEIVFVAIAEGRFGDLENMVEEEELRRLELKYSTVSAEEKERILKYWSNLDNLFFQVLGFGKIIFQSGEDENDSDAEHNAEAAVTACCFSHNMKSTFEKPGFWAKVQHGVEDVLSSKFYFQATFSAKPIGGADWTLSDIRVVAMRGMSPQKRII